MAAASSKIDGTTLTKIFKVDEELLREKFGLQPYHCYDPLKKDNLVFMSPTVCLQDLELREGGLKDTGAKEVLGRLAKDILRSKDLSLFQVPEITSFHMGYGKTSEYKKTNMAINEFEAKAWMDVFDLAAIKAKLSACPAPNDNNESAIHGEEETPMEVDFEFPKPEDTHALEEENSEDVINPTDSGLKIGVKPRYLLLFSILMIFYKKKLEGKSSSRNLIGENKISDFLLFWILPYLLYYTEQQVNIVNEHHWAQSREKGIPQFSVPVVQKSAREIIKDALRSCKVTQQLHEKLYAKLKLYYGTDQLERKYKLPAVEVRGKLLPSEPIILVPLRYQVTDMPVQIEDIGRRWKEIGKVNLLDQFISVFIDNREIQKDILWRSFRELELKEKCALDYGILLPDEDTFTEFMEMVGKKPDIFREFQCTVLDKQGRDLATPRIGLVKSGENYLSVCFSYFEENDNKKVATLFRVIGSHRVNHFTLALLYGACIDSSDPKMLGCLYPVRSALKFEFKSGKLQKCQMSKEKTGEGFIKGHFNRLEFPVTFKSFLEKVKTDKLIKDVVIKSRGKLDYPKFEHQRPVKVAYTSGSQSERLRAGNAHKKRQKKRHKQKIKMLKKHVKAASLEGCLLYMIARSGPKCNTAVVMGINDTLEFHEESLEDVAKVVRRTIIYFVMAAVIAGLPKVYRPEGNIEERIVEPGTDDDDDEDEDDDDDDDSDDDDGGGEDDLDMDCNSFDDSGYVCAGPSGVVSQPVVATTIKVKDGVPSDDDLEDLSQRIVNWRKLGRRLKIDEPHLISFEKEHGESSEGAYHMLLYWKQMNGCEATYQILNSALCHKFVSQRQLAEEICCEVLSTS